jgi:hypothetical protein
MINEVLARTSDKTRADNVWLADSIESLIEEDEVATMPPVDESWQSPFAGQPVEKAFEYLATVSLEKSLNRAHIVVLNKALYEQKDWLAIYQIDENGEITSVPCATRLCMVFIDSYTLHLWPEYLEEWRRDGKPIFQD